MNKIIFQKRKFDLEFREYHPNLLLSFWSTDDFLKQYVAISGKDVGFIYIVTNGEFSGFMESESSNILYNNFGSKIDKKWMDKHIGIYYNELNKLVSNIDYFEKKVHSKESLIKFFIELKKSLGILNPYSNIFYLVSRNLEKNIISKLIKLGYKENAQSILAENSVPLKETFSMSYNKHIEEAASYLKRKKFPIINTEQLMSIYSKDLKFKKIVEDIEKKFYCLSSLNSGKRTFLSFLVDISEKYNKKNAPVNKLNFPKEIEKEIYLLRGIINFKDDCSTYLPPYVKYALEKTWADCAKYLEINPEDIFQLLIDELIEFLKKKPEDIKKLVSERKKNTFFIHHPYIKTKIFEGKKAEEYTNNVLSQIEEVNSNEIKKIIGKVGSKGFFKGYVHKIINSSEIKTIKEGEVMVSIYTGPEFVPAMKKAGAIVTDQGGLTSHAAIVARELNKPCIVDTKIATKVLKDGDLVEVDADKGVVKIIERKK